MEIDLDRLHAQTTVTDQYCALVIAREIRALYAGFDNPQTPLDEFANDVFSYIWHDTENCADLEDAEPTFDDALKAAIEAAGFSIDRVAAKRAES